MPADGLDLAPFRGLRYVPAHVTSLAAVTSPPYDVVVWQDIQRELETSDPHNIVRLILPQAGAPATGHRQAADTLRRWRANGVLATDPEPALYVYEQRRGDLLQRGVIGALRLTPTDAGIVLPHESVIPEVVADRAALMRATEANLEPVLLSYRGDGTATGTAATVDRVAHRAPLLTTTTRDGFTHRLWPVTDPTEITEITSDLSRHQALISDGHHRWATCLRLSEEHGAQPPWDRGLVLLVDTARYPLRVHAVHRVLPGLPPAEALTRLTDSGAFRVRRVEGPVADALRALRPEAGAAGNAFVLAGAGSYHLLDRPDPALLARTVRADRPALWRGLDATVLHATLLNAVWQVRDRPGTVSYVHDAHAAVAEAEQCGGTAVLLRAVPESTVRALAEQGVTMPHKTTSFGPKPATGIVLRSLR